MNDYTPKLRCYHGIPTKRSLERYNKLLKQKYCKEELGKNCLHCDSESCEISPNFDDETFGDKPLEVN